MKRIVKLTLIGVLFLLYFISVLYESDLYGNILSPIITLISAYYVYKGYFLKEDNIILRRGGFFLALCLLNWGLFDVLWAVTDLMLGINPDHVFLISYGYCLSNVFLLLALVIVGYFELKNWNRVQVLVDTAAISLCTAILAWVIFLNQNMKNIVMLKNDWISMVTVILNILIFTWTTVWFITIRKGKVSLTYKISLIGVFVFLIADIIYYYKYFYTLYEANTLLDGAYAVSFGLMALGASVKDWKKESSNGIIYKQSNRREKGVLLIIAPIILILFKGLQWEYLLSMISIIMFYFLLTNYIQKNVYRDEIFQKEIELNLQLEKKVKERTEELNHLLNKDVITGLYSRRYFLEQLDCMIHKLDQNESILLFYIDVNRYKMIKMMFGNYIGEKALVEMGKRLSNYELGPEDILASYGEDVFVFAMKGDYTYDKGVEIAKKIIALSSDIYQVDDFAIRITVNIGIAAYPTDSQSKDELMKHADIAMAQARSDGFNKIMTFDKNLVELVSYRNRIEIMLKKVDYDKDFFLYYQPQISLQDESVIGFEALIRWKTQEGEFIPPGQFIPIAEETGFIIPIGYWVIQKAMKQLAQWDRVSKRKPRVAINVSVKQLNERNFITRFQEILEKNNIEPNRVEIEIIESVQLEESAEMKEMLQNLKELGITIAVDDFGTGYSSLYYLKNLPVDRIKIAKQLIDRIDQDIYDYTIVKTAMSIARVKGLKVIAEGVETKEQLECLRKLECDEIQGYYYAKPMSPEEALERWIE